MERPPSPDKRSRPMRNPLRRGPSSRQDMQTIPSPPPSAHDPSSPPRRGPPLNKISTQSSERAQPGEDQQRRRNEQPIEDSIQQAPIRVSSLPMTNGVSKEDPRQESNNAPPPGPPPNKAAIEEVTDSQRKSTYVC